MRITHLRLENWRNFKVIDVDLADRVFVVGANAAGKSNLLDAIRFVRDIAVPEGGLRSAVEQPTRRSVKQLRSLFARQQTDVAVEVGVGNGKGPDWLYRVAFTEAQGKPRVTAETVRRGKHLILHRPDAKDEKDPALLVQTHLEQVSANGDFRELADFLAGIRYLHVVPQLVRDPERFIPRARDPYGSDFINQMATVHHQTRAYRLRRIAAALAGAVPHLKELQLRRDNGVNHLRYRFEHWRPAGAWQTEEQFSDGTLRLIGLLWGWLDGDGPVLLEEPELSVHPALVRELIPMMQRVREPDSRQVFISTHSTDLMRVPGIDAAEVLLLLPGREGTEVIAGSDHQLTCDLLEGGMPAGEAVLPLVAPRR